MNDRSGPNTKFMKVQREQDKTSLDLEGEWTLPNAAVIERNIEDMAPALDRPYEISAEHIDRLDTTGAFLLKKLGGRNEPPSHLKDEQRNILEFLPPYSEYAPHQTNKQNAFVAFFDTIGKNTFVALDFLWQVFAFIGRIAGCFFANLSRPRRFRLPSIVRHVHETGLSALPIIALLAVLITMVITYQGAVQLRRFGADIYTVDLTVISLLREMGVLVTAIMVAGRSGSAFAAEIGAMKLRDEVSALRTMGLSPIEVLVLPRVIALMVTLPLLTFLADLTGLLGGALMSMSLLDMSFQQYLGRVEEAATPTMFFVGMIKAPVFAFAIAVIGCYQGLNVKGSAESIGRNTTLAVVQAIFVVMMADGLFSVVFSRAEI
jgi:phospholipid/cholesterol/gamma-HCH transport system permease protein